MKITNLETFVLWDRSAALKVSTDEGLSGWGEPVVEGRADTTTAAVHEMAELLIGRDPDQIEDIWQSLYRGGFYRGGPILMSAIAGIDQALWDIKGKRYGLPVYQMLGGRVRDRMQVYAWIGGENPEQAAAMARERLVQGYQAIKMSEGAANMRYFETRAVVDAVIEMVGAVRQAIGNETGLGIDFHGHLHKGLAKVVAHELEQFHPLFIEEPVLPENNEALREIARASSIPIATGERMFSRWDFKKLLQEGYVDIIQPDLSHAGGISEVRRIAAMAEAYDVAVAPHCPLGPLAFLSALQLDFAAPNAFIQEQVLELHDVPNSRPLQIMLNRYEIQYKDGFIAPPAGPGLGIEVDEGLVRQIASEGGRWHVPLCRASDGSIAEW